MSLRNRRQARQWTDDAALSRRAAVDPSAKEAIYRAHVDAVYRLALRLLDDPGDAEDAVQETFIQVFRGLGAYRGESSLRTWIHRITVRTALRQRKRTRRQRPTLMVVRDHGAPGQDTCCDEHRALDAVHALLQRLSPRRRAVFLLHEVEGYTLPEAAALLGVSVTAAKKLVWRARRDLDRLVASDPRLCERIARPRGER